MKPRAIIALMTLIAALGACERRKGPEPIPDASQDPLAALVAEYGEPVRTYEVRGQVERLPDPERAGTDFVVHHEAIDDFLNQKGEVHGMHSMIMPFVLAEGVELPPELEPGDKVLISCAQWLEPEFTFLAYKVETLPDDTELTFRRANPPGESDEPGVAPPG